MKAPKTMRVLKEINNLGGEAKHVEAGTRVAVERQASAASILFTLIAPGSN
jgi:hypothetical protein